MLLLFLFALSIRELLAEPAQAPENQMMQSSALNIVTDFNSSLIQPYNSLNASDLNGKMFVECDGDKYGVNLDLSDCKDAKNNVPYKSQQWAFAQRHTPTFVKNKVFPLPYRIMGGTCDPSSALLEEHAIWGIVSLMMLTDKGSCYVDTTLDEGRDIAHASLGQVQMAADAVISKCVKTRNPQGGVAHNIGNLSLVTSIDLRDYRPLDTS